MRPVLWSMATEGSKEEYPRNPRNLGKRNFQMSTPKKILESISKAELEKILEE